MGKREIRQTELLEYFASGGKLSQYHVCRATIAYWKRTDADFCLRWADAKIERENTRKQKKARNKNIRNAVKRCDIEFSNKVFQMANRWHDEHAIRFRLRFGERLSYKAIAHSRGVSIPAVRNSVLLVLSRIAEIRKIDRLSMLAINGRIGYGG